jgi:CheY-like chemotaxis protein
MDLQMPNMVCCFVLLHCNSFILTSKNTSKQDGLAATSKIMEQCEGHPEDERPMVVAVTANVYDSDREACCAVGMCDFIPKPIKLDLLKAVLERCRQRRFQL